MSKKVNFNNFASEVMKITKDYAQEVEDESSKVVMETAFEAEEQLHVAGSFKNGKKGEYRKGWTITFNQTRYSLEAIVHNKVYMLTHLLESGHAKWLWGKDTGQSVQAFPHIEEVNNEAQKKLEEEIKRRLQ
jgi:hypothetical protein